MSKTMDDILKQVEEGANFAGKGGIDPLNRLDFLKREACAFFVGEFKNGISEEEIINKAKITSIVEYRAIIKFRSERLTLERLMECYDNYNGVSTIEELKLSLLEDIHKAGFSNIKMTPKIRVLVEAKTIRPLYLDYLVDLLERCQPDSNHEETKSIFLKHG